MPGDENEPVTQDVANRWLVTQTITYLLPGVITCGLCINGSQSLNTPHQGLNRHTNDGFDDHFVRHVAIRPTNPKIDVPFAKREVAHQKRGAAWQEARYGAVQSASKSVMFDAKLKLVTDFISQFSVNFEGGG